MAQRTARGSALAALTLLLGLQMLRVVLPLGYRLGEETSFLGAGLAVMAVFLSPVLAPVFGRIAGPRTALVASVGALAVMRVAIWVVRPIPLWLAVVAIVAFLWAMALVVARLRAGGREGGHRLALGLLLGLAVDVAVQAAFRTWDPAWQQGLLATVVGVAIGAAAVAAAWRPAVAEDVSTRPGAGTIVLLGPFLALQVLMLDNVAFAASVTGWGIASAAALLLVGSAAAVATAQLVAARGMPVGLLAASGLLLAAGAGLLPGARGIPAALLLPAAQVLAGAALISMLARGDGRRAATWPTGVAWAGAGALLILLLLLYYLHYDVPLPFPNAVLPAVAGLLVALSAQGRDAGRALGPASLRLVAVPVALLLVPAATALGSAAREAAPGQGSTFRVVSYNIHTAVSTDGQVDPEATARVIEAEDPDVVLLQEVTRGWVIAGSLDSAEYLSDRLGMPYVYAGAADGQFGNAILSRFPILEWETTFLPQGTGPMRRNAVRAVLDLGRGERATVIVAHLDHREEGAPTRLGQIERLVELSDGDPRAVVAGDMNARPGSEELARLTGAGLVSAQDEVGDPSLGTYPSTDPDRRIDYIFGGRAVEFADFSRPLTTASDHLPLAVTVSLR